MEISPEIIDLCQSALEQVIAKKLLSVDFKKVQKPTANSLSF